MRTPSLAIPLAIFASIVLSGCVKSGSGTSSATPREAVRKHLKAELTQREDELQEEVAWYEPVMTVNAVTISKLGKGGSPEGSTNVPAGSTAIRLEFRTKHERLDRVIYRNPSKNYDLVFILPQGTSTVAGMMPTKFAVGEKNLLGPTVDWKRKPK